MIVESSMKTKKELIASWRQEVQRAGTINVLHTNAIAQRIGLSATEFEAIDVVTNSQPVTAGKLAISCGLTTGAITGLVDRLQASGFIRRRSDPDDRRRVLLEPVENSKCSEEVKRLYQPIAAGFDNLADEYTAEELAFLIESQRKLNDMAQHAIEQLPTIK